MRILIINSGKDLYGSEQSMLAALPEGERLFAIPAEGMLAAELECRGEKVFPLVFNHKRFLRYPFGHVRLLAQLIRLGVSWRPEVILINLGGNMSVIIAAAALLRIPIVRFERFEVRGSHSWNWRMLESFCEAAICPSQTVASQVRHALRKPRARVLSWHDPITACDWKRSDATRRWRDVIYVGRICPGKLIDVAIRAMELVWEKVPEARLLIYGSHNGSPEGIQLEQKLRGLAYQIDTRERIVFCGFCANVVDRIAEGAVLVLPSQSESFGRVLAEAWIRGVPTVASEIPGCAEITRASGGGRLAPVGDALAFGQALASFLLDKEEAQRAGSQGREWVQENCSPIGFRRKLTDLLQDIAGKGLSVI